MKTIAIIGWGSLIWEKERLTLDTDKIPQGNIALATGWAKDKNSLQDGWVRKAGPELPLEFSRISEKTRHGALTLVIDREHGKINPTSFAVSYFGDLEKAIQNLAEREGTTRENIGIIMCGGTQESLDEVQRTIFAWAEKKKTEGLDFAAVIWTALPANFDKVDKTKCSDVKEPDMKFSADNAKEYLLGLKVPGDREACTYINNTLPEIETTLLTSLRNDSQWLAKCQQLVSKKPSEREAPSAKIYCDGERDQFDEKEFLHLEDQLFKPYIHLESKHIPAHFADGGLPIVLKKDEHNHNNVTPIITNPTPISVSNLSRNRDILEKIGSDLLHSATTDSDDAVWQYAGLDWPHPIPIEDNNDLLADQKKALYQAQLQVVTSTLQGYIDHDKAVRTNDYPLHQAVFQAYIDVAKGQIDRSVTRTQFIATVAGAIGTLYAAVLGLAFGLGQPDHTLPARGIAPAIFLGLAFVLAAFYLSYITKQSQAPDPSHEAVAERSVSYLPAQRLIEERNDFIQWVSTTVVQRLELLHAAVISLAVGVLFLPAPFVAISDQIVWVVVAIGIIVVCIPIVYHLLTRQNKRKIRNGQPPNLAAFKGRARQRKKP